jgi:hypothetical protein
MNSKVGVFVRGFYKKLNGGSQYPVSYPENPIQQLVIVLEISPKKYPISSSHKSSK